MGIDMKRVDFHLTEEQIEFLKQLKKEMGIPASETIRQLINLKMEAVDAQKKAKETGNKAGEDKGTI